MRKEDAEKIVQLLLTADGGCEYCVADLLKLFCTEFPEHKKLARTVFRERFGLELEHKHSSRVAKTAKDKFEEHCLHGWDDEKVYFWDGKEEICVSDEKELYNRLLEICINYFKKERRKRSEE